MRPSSLLRPRLARAGAIAFLAVSAAACRRPAPAPSPAPAADQPAPPPVRPLAGMAAMRVVVAPVYALRGGDVLGWSATLGAPRALLRQLDDEIAFALGERGLSTAWSYPEALAQSYRRNPTMAPDPYALGVEPLRGARLQLGQRIPEPLASQLRALVALQPEARYVLLPVELRIEPEAGTAPGGVRPGRAVLQLVLVDARRSDVRWLGEARSDVFPSPGRALVASVAAGLADLVVAP